MINSVDVLYETLESVIKKENIECFEHIHFSESDGNLSFRFEYENENGYNEKTLILTKGFSDVIRCLISDIRSFVGIRKITLSNMVYDLFVEDGNKVNEFYDIELIEIKNSKLIFRKQDGNKMVVYDNKIYNLEFVNFTE